MNSRPTIRWGKSGRILYILLFQFCRVSVDAATCVLEPNASLVVTTKSPNHPRGFQSTGTNGVYPYRYKSLCTVVISHCGDVAYLVNTIGLNSHLHRAAKPISHTCD